VPIALVLTQPDRPAGRRRLPTPPPVAVTARRLGLPLLQPERAAEAMDDVARAGVAAMAICAYGQLIRRPFLEQLPWLNLHPSALPRWRGAAPVERALLDGDTETAVAVMQIVEALDAGPVAAQIPFPIGPDDDAGHVMRVALELGVPALGEALEATARGTLALRPQAETGVTYADKLGPADRLLDPQEPRATALNRVRALSPHIGALVRLGDETVTVWRARPSERRLGPHEVATGDGALLVGFGDGALEVLVLQLPGKRALPAADVLRGRRRPLAPAARPTLAGGR
jgi:methionyl-tRNA formyltransferase